MNASHRHFPVKKRAVPDIPYTLNIQKAGIAVRKVIHNQPVCNKDAPRDPEALDFYAGLTELQEN
jgi:acetoacetyl-CoA synthetase